MRTMSLGLLSAGAIALAITFGSGAASAQLKGPDAPKAAKEPAKKAAPKSACQGLDQTACTVKASECHWIREAEISKGPQKGTKRAAHCAKLPTKKAEVKKAAPPKAPEKK